MIPFKTMENGPQVIIVPQYSRAAHKPLILYRFKCVWYHDHTCMTNNYNNFTQQNILYIL